MNASPKRVLIVDDEDDLTLSLERRLSAALPGVEVRGVTSPAVALQLIAANEHSLVITDMRMPGHTGMELLLHARERWPSVPFVVMTAFPTESTRREATQLGSVHYIEKPFEFGELLAIVRDILTKQQARGFSGAVPSATLPDLVQLFVMSCATGALSVWAAEDQGTLWFDRGSIVHATTGSKSGRAAVLEVIGWAGGKFSMNLNLAPPAHTVRDTTMALLMEALVLSDERSAGHRGPPDATEEDDSFRESTTLDLANIAPPIRSTAPAAPLTPAASTAARVSTAARASTAPAASTAPTATTQGENTMSNNVNSTLEKLRSIDGYVGACIVDAESAMALGLDGGGGLNLEVAAAGNAEVVKAKRKTMRALGIKDEIEDILISLGKQYHLIRPVKSRGSVFMYLALDRSRSNLAMARMALSEAEKQLEI